MGTPQSAMLRSQGKLSRRKVVTRSSLSNQRYLSLRLDQQSKYVYIHCTYLYCDCTVCSSLVSVYNKCTSNFFLVPQGKPSARRELRMLPSRDDVVKSTFGKISSTGIIDLDSLSSVFTSEENDR